jgi:hypothetical protein
VARHFEHLSATDREVRALDEEQRLQTGVLDPLRNLDNGHRLRVDLYTDADVHRKPYGVSKGDQRLVGGGRSQRPAAGQ